ncbi:MAG: hypothetical protein OXT67_05950 [Zetaproteobacteria bacterium]|nr:hypothetical protein [Zetaproteobacteria bacterium]
MTPQQPSHPLHDRITALGFLGILLYGNLWFLTDLAGTTEHWQALLDILAGGGFLCLLVGIFTKLLHWIACKYDR